MSSDDARLEQLAARGVRIVDARQTFLAPTVDLGRIQAGVVLHPGVRLEGPRTFLGEGAEVGREGPAVLVDTVLDAGARLDGGFARGAVLLAGAIAGAGAHLREATLLEEQASTAHTVGLKHAILLAFATVGSLVNLCDALIGAGTSRRRHTEIGSGYIHFNYTPWGAEGDKATPSRVGHVPTSVFLRDDPVFLGGSGGMVGPRVVGSGAIVAAGQVLRDDVAAGHLVTGQRPRVHDRPIEPDHLDAAQPRAQRNVDYVAQLVALREWYRQVRLARESRPERRVPLEEAIAGLGAAIDERLARLRAFLDERRVASPRLRLEEHERCPFDIGADEPLEHLAWVQALPDATVVRGRAWLERIVSAVAD